MGQDVESKESTRQFLERLLCEMELPAERFRVLSSVIQWFLFIIFALSGIWALKWQLALSLWISIPVSLAASGFLLERVNRIISDLKMSAAGGQLKRATESFLEFFPSDDHRRDSALADLVLMRGTVLKYKNRSIAVEPVRQMLEARLKEMNLFTLYADAQIAKGFAEVKPRSQNLGTDTVYGQEFVAIRAELRRSGGSHTCIACGGSVHVNLAQLEDHLIKSKQMMHSLSTGGRVVIYEQPPELYDVAVCPNQKGLLCLACIDRAVKLNAGSPRCPKCDTEIRGLDQLVK